jgi:hypothetical protein
LIVPEPPPLLLLLLEALEPLPAALELELPLEPHAATASDEAATAATVAIRLGVKVTSPSLGVRQSLRPSIRGGVSRL